MGCCHRNPEARAYILDCASRATVGISNIFLGYAILKYAAKAAGCEEVRNLRPSRKWGESAMLRPRAQVGKEICGKRLPGGLRASSLLTVMLTVGYVAVALCLPLVGALVDSTPHRRRVGLYTSYVLIAIQALEMGISEATWEAMAALQVAAQVAYLLHLVPHFAYIPELTRDETDLASIQATALGSGYGASFFMILCIIGAGGGALDAARVGQGLSAFALAATLPYAWHVLNADRPALRKRAPGTPLVVAGFARLRTTAAKTRTEYPELWQFILGLSCWEASTSAFLGLLPTYLAVFVQMTANQIASTLGVALVFTIAGAFASKRLIAASNPKAVVIGALTFLALVAFALPLVVAGPKQKGALYAFGACIGFGNGVAYPAQRVLFTLLIPGGCEAEMWGIYSFAGAVLVWVPPLVFTLINELAGMRFALWSLCVLYAAGIPRGAAVDLDKARADVASTLGARHYDHQEGAALPPPNTNGAARTAPEAEPTRVEA